MNATIRTAIEQDADAIAALIHDTYALELGQYNANEAGRITDRLHNTNLYLVACMDTDLAGMLSITLPSAASFSTLNRLPLVPEDVANNLHKTAEIRLLAIKPTYRGQGVFDQLMQAAIITCYGQGIDRVLISAISNRVSLYEFMGFQTVGEAVQEGTAVFQPMIITRQTLEASPYMQKLAMRKIPA